MIGTRRGPWVGLWIGLFFAMVLTLSACTGDPGKDAAKAHTAEANSAKTRPLPDLGIPPTPTNLAPGRYVTNTFEASVSFIVGKGWAINNPEKTDHFSIYSRDFAKSDKETGPSSSSSTSRRSSILRVRRRATSTPHRKIYSHGSNSIQAWISRNQLPQP
jgi:hypothetical protein